MSVPDHLTAAVHDARALAARGDLRGAQALLERVLDPAATVLGPDHAEVLTGTRLLASLHRRLGDLAHARRLLEDALAAGHFTLGEDSPHLLPLSYDLATLADELGNRHEARRNFGVLLRHGPAVLGADHEYVRAARRYLDGAAAPGPPPPAAPPAAPSPAAPPAVPPLPSAPATFPPSAPPSRAQRDDAHHHSRVPMLALVLIAAMALAGGGIAAFLVFHAPGGGRGPVPGPSAATPPDALKPPGDLTLRDEGTSITLAWTDPTHGAAPFVIAGGRSDNAPIPLGSVESGKNTYTLSGINTRADYCFLVAVVYSPQHTVPSRLICTRRGASPSTNRRPAN
ncbi:tetratricopeptide repeat protein [Planosporangium thailandense]|uniref:Tetratricopeptide repeat protein n=1 Tax=Planosporangium thailandense TaxID=765197 RepID=A0ABX0XWP5_9ACTN|nr:tetratricopeptide repeat protein [Planosporangium thailandense]